jgi:hypothetical protein
MLSLVVNVVPKWKIWCCRNSYLPLFTVIIIIIFGDYSFLYFLDIVNVLCKRYTQISVIMSNSHIRFYLFTYPGDYSNVLTVSYRHLQGTLIDKGVYLYVCVCVCVYIYIKVCWQ